MKLITVFRTYFMSVSILAHCLILVIAVYFLSDRVTSHWRWPIIKHWVFGDIDNTDVYPMSFNDFESLPKGRWVKIHQQKPDDRVHFYRQAYAGSAFNQSNSQLYIFGSNTHSNEWNNSVYSFDMSRLLWNEAYLSDSPATYTANSDGIPVAGVNNSHPWAMQTFAAIVYDQAYQKLVVASFPKPFDFGNKESGFANKWQKVKQHPTWFYDPVLTQWTHSKGNSIQFIPYSIAYDTDRKVVTGFRPDGIYDWSRLEERWLKVGTGSYKEYHTNAVYDSKNQVFILYGGNALKNTIYFYAVGNKSTQQMLTAGVRPPAGQSVPLAFHQKMAKVVAVIDVDDYAQTWLYDYSSDQWQRLSKADFPYHIGMNYSMEYDAQHNVVVLISSPKGEETAVWVLRL